ncbi:hypothetical protein ViNHUV68_35420 [Vibrio sp. NH-UV-68]
MMNSCVLAVDNQVLSDEVMAKPCVFANID